MGTPYQATGSARIAGDLHRAGVRPADGAQAQGEAAPEDAGVPLPRLLGARCLGARHACICVPRADPVRREGVAPAKAGDHGDEELGEALAAGPPRLGLGQARAGADAAVAPSERRLAVHRVETILALLALLALLAMLAMLEHKLGGVRDADAQLLDLRLLFVPHEAEHHQGSRDQVVKEPH
eukprot:scaffold312_cov256-Pinguiococcus_pyrenoidosus.AAC.1